MRKFEGFQRGVNLGGWISQFAKYDITHFNTFITEKDIQDIAELGFDHVRVPVDYNVLEDEEGNLIESGFTYLEKCREWCERAGLKMVLDLHECYGYSFDPLKKDMDRAKFFYDEALQARFMKLWREIATRFSAYSEQVAFEPLNEVVLYEVHDAWNEIVTKFIKMIREVCPSSYIIVGGVCYNSVFTIPLINIPIDDKIVYNFHCYEPMVFTHQGAYWVDNMPSDFRMNYPVKPGEAVEATKLLPSEFHDSIDKMNHMGPDFFEQIFLPAIEEAEKKNVPLYCGEYGVIDLADNRSKINWLKDIQSIFKKYGIGNALWNYKEKDFGIVDDTFAEIKDDFIACMKSNQ